MIQPFWIVIVSSAVSKGGTENKRQLHTGEDTEELSKMVE